jgi:transcriptional regulator with XRE-family HTH domain
MAKKDDKSGKRGKDSKSLASGVAGLARDTLGLTTRLAKAQGADMALKVAAEALRVADRTRSKVVTPETQKVLTSAGATIKDLREVAGLTRQDLTEALKLKDKTLIAAVEEGTASLSFELILRLSSVLARHDPLPLVLQLTRTYNPDLWAALENWGPGRLPLQYERERMFINIYRRHDQARELADDDFRKVLDFTNQAFETALHFALKHPVKETARAARKKKQDKDS